MQKKNKNISYAYMRSSNIINNVTIYSTRLQEPTQYIKILQKAQEDKTRKKINPTG